MQILQPINHFIFVVGHNICKFETVILYSFELLNYQ